MHEPLATWQHLQISGKPNWSAQTSESFPVLLSTWTEGTKASALQRADPLCQVQTHPVLSAYVPASTSRAVKHPVAPLAT